MRILVTAVGGDIGQTIVRVLRRWDTVRYIAGTDLHENHVGKLRVDNFSIVPRADDPKYIDAILALCSRQKIDAVIPVNENEIVALSDASSASAEIEKMLIVARGIGIRSCFDKHECHRFLESKGIPVPWTVLSSVSPPEYPCILKKKKGSGSKGFAILRNEAEWKFFASREKDTIVQQYLLPDDEEYTCGVFRSRFSPEVRVVSLKRKLMGGLTGTAEVVVDREIHEYCAAIATALDLRGSINIQLRRTASGPRLLEINPRFSSTAGFRDATGFKDVVWSIQEACGTEAEPYHPESIAGRKFFRFFDEIYV